MITSGTLMGDDGSGAPARESFFNSAHSSPRTASELAGQQLLEAGVDVRVVRLPQVHDTVRQGLLTCYIERAVANGAVALRGEEATAGQPPMSMTSHVCMSARCFRARPASAIMRWPKRDRITRYCRGNCPRIKPAADPRMSRRSTHGSAGLRRLPPLTCAPARHGPASACSGSRLAPGCWRTCRTWTIIK